jgi:uncharacterized Zn finger protein (UPF0148 family)
MVSIKCPKCGYYDFNSPQTICPKCGHKRYLREITDQDKARNELGGGDA